MNLLDNDKNDFTYCVKDVGRRAAMLVCLKAIFSFPKSFLKLLFEELSMTASLLLSFVRLHTIQIRLAMNGKVMEKVMTDTDQSSNSDQK